MILNDPCVKVYVKGVEYRRLRVDEKGDGLKLLLDEEFSRLKFTMVSIPYGCMDVDNFEISLRNLKVTTSTLVQHLQGMNSGCLKH